MNELLGLMLVESPLVCLSHPGCIYRAIKSDDSVDTAVRAERRMSDRLTVRPLLHSARKKLGKAVKTYRDVTCE